MQITDLWKSSKMALVLRDRLRRGVPLDGSPMGMNAFWHDDIAQQRKRVAVAGLGEHCANAWQSRTESSSGR